MTIAKQLFTATLFAAATALLATACTQESDPLPGKLPAGKYPVDFTATVYAPVVSRAAAAEGQWTTGDTICLRMAGERKEYTATTTGSNTSFQPAEPGNPLYWSSAKPAEVDAWYYGRPTGNGTDVPTRWSVLSDQNTPVTPGADPYQQSAFLYAPASTFTYNGNNSLTFYQQTAKVNIHIRKYMFYSVVGIMDPSKYIVTIGDADNPLPLEATFHSDRTTADPFSGLEADATGRQGYIIPQKVEPASDDYVFSYRALLVPQNVSGKKFISIKFHTYAQAYYVPLPGEGDLRGGYEYTYIITASKYGKFEFQVLPGSIGGWGTGTTTGIQNLNLIDLSAPSEISGNGIYLLTGNTVHGIKIVSGSPTIILEDAHITTVSPILVENNSSPKIVVRGRNNTITGVQTPGIALRGANAHVEILGDSKDYSTLTVTGGTDIQGVGTPGIGNYGDDGFGNITVSDLTLNVSGGQPAEGKEGGAAIGTRAKDFRQGGDITIRRSHINAVAYGGAAAIGLGYNESSTIVNRLGKIYIGRPSTIASKVHKGPNGRWPAHIGGSAKNNGRYDVGTIEIITWRTTQKEFFKNFTYGGATDENDKCDVIVGFPDEAPANDMTPWSVSWDDGSNEQQGYIRWSGIPEK